MCAPGILFEISPVVGVMAETPKMEKQSPEDLKQPIRVRQPRQPIRELNHKYLHVDRAEAAGVDELLEGEEEL